jgi:membrane protein
VNGLAQATDAWRALVADVRVIFSQFGRQDILFHAGSVAYSAALAGIPFFLVLASAIGYVLGGSTLAASDDTLYRFLAELLPERTALAAIPIIEGVLADVKAARGSTGIVGLVLFAWFSTRFFGALRASLASVFAVDRGRGIVEGKLLDLLYVAVGAVVVTVYLALTLAFGTRVGPAMVRAFSVDPDALGLLAFVGGRLVSTAFLAAMFTTLYKVLPNRPVRWEAALWGGVWGATLFEIARTVIFETITRAMNPASLYSGTLAAIVVVVFWAYYAAVVFLIGGVIARVHELRAARRAPPLDKAPGSP